MLTLAGEVRDLRCRPLVIAGGNHRHGQVDDKERNKHRRVAGSHIHPVAEKGLHVLRSAIVGDPNEQACMPSLHHEMGTSEGTVESRSTRSGESTETGSAAASDDECWNRVAAQRLTHAEAWVEEATTPLESGQHQVIIGARSPSRA